MKNSRSTLPKTVGSWTRPDSPMKVNAQNIFDYMDGAGELYLGYGFDHLEVYTYKAQDQMDILVELYHMKTADDAFGLLSLDWGGESFNLSGSSSGKEDTTAENWPQALYGKGLLHLRAENIFARVMATQETPESREAVLVLGKAVARGRLNPTAPAVVRELPDTLLPGWKLNKQRVSYFRSHLVLNSLYYLGQDNMLDLDLSAEAVTAPYQKKNSSEDRKRLQLLIIRYPDKERARKALAHFHQAYLPEYPLDQRSPPLGELAEAFSTEDSWLGYKLRDRNLVLVFDCPDKTMVWTILDQIK